MKEKRKHLSSKADAKKGSWRLEARRTKAKEEKYGFRGEAICPVPSHRTPPRVRNPGTGGGEKKMGARQKLTREKAVIRAYKRRWLSVFLEVKGLSEKGGIRKKRSLDMGRTLKKKRTGGTCWRSKGEKSLMPGK